MMFSCFTNQCNCLCRAIVICVFTLPFLIQSLLINGAVVHLKSKKTGTNLIIGNWGNVNAKEHEDGKHVEYG